MKFAIDAPQFEECKTEYGINLKYEAVVKRFSDKLLIVLTDGAKFGNIISASYTKFDSNMDDDLDNNFDLDSGLQEDEQSEDFKIEYNGTLLLGDRAL